MMRNIEKLANTEFDLLVVGGGINGAVLSWQASLAGLSVALIEQGDFAQATSANSQKIIHGGLRYLQHLDIHRIKQSLRERKHLMWLAPHLIHPLPCTMPLYGHGIKGKEALWLALRLFDLIGRDRNGTPDPSKFIPAGKILSADETNRLIPNLTQKGLNGAAQWYDAMCFNTERLVLSFIKSAQKMGAVVANYVKAIKVTHNKDSLNIVTSHDTLSEQSLDIRAKKVINITGPWINDLLNYPKLRDTRPKVAFASGINIITNQLFPLSTAVGLRNPQDNKSRLYFVVPWRGKSIIGTEWFIYHDHPDHFKVNEWQCSQLIAGFNSAYPSAKLTLNDVLHVHGGLVPCTQKNGYWTQEIPLLKHFRIIDHSNDRIKRMLSVVGVKYTTGGDVAEKVLRYMFPSISITPPLSRPQLSGGEIENFSTFKAKILHKWKSKIREDELVRLVLNYGTEMEKIIKIAIDENISPLEERGDALDILKGETLFAVREEMAQKLSDVIMRRTDRGTAGHVAESDLTKISLLMAKELDWTEARRISEIEEVNNGYPPFIK